MISYKLRPWRLSDASSLAANANNIAIRNNLRDSFPYPYRVKDAHQYIQSVISMPEPATIKAIAVGDKAVGSIGVSLKSDIERISAEIGFWIGERYWNKGIMTAAVREMTAYAFANFHLIKIYALVFDSNIASQRVLQKAGFEQEGILRQAAVKDGKIIDLHYYGIVKKQAYPNLRFRLYTEWDAHVMPSLIYNAIYIPEELGNYILEPEIIKEPAVEIYYKDFGTKADDLCILALNGKEIAGGVWTRIFSGGIKGYAYIDAYTPELTISVFKKYRKNGIGTELMCQMIDLLAKRGYRQVSLSVTKANYAVRIFKRLGFEVKKEGADYYIMVRILKK